MGKVDIKSNRAALKYTKRELFLRILWGAGKVLFRVTPRPCFAIRRNLLRLFGAKIGDRVNIYPSAMIYYPWNLKVGDDSAIGEWALVYNLGSVEIGERVTISQRVHLCAGTHDYTDPSMPLIKPSIVVSDEAWVCADAFVGPGVHVGHRSIIAAASVLVKNCAPSSIVGGNPAKFLKVRI